MTPDRHDIAPDWPTGFMLIHGNRLETLCELLVAWMRRHPLEPLEDEVLLVQSNGIAQWLKLALAAGARADGSGGYGIAAALRAVLPARFIWQAYRSVLGALPETSPFDRQPLAWRLYRLLDDPDGLEARLGIPAARNPLHGFLDADPDPRRRYRLAQRLAGLYDQYQVYRADWLQAWERGRDRLPGAPGAARPIPPGQEWQPALWRTLHQDIAAAERTPSRAEIHRRFLNAAARLTPATRPAELPRRVSVFGISALPQQWLEVLQALAPLTQVLLFVHNPSQHDWSNLVEGRTLFRQSYRRHAARPVPAATAADPEALHLHGHPLLAAWGRQGRDYIRLLDEHDDRLAYEAWFREANLKIDLFEPPGDATLLQQLQDDILELRSLRERQDRAAAIDPARDRSIEFLVAHSPLREIEILHDQLLDAFEQALASGAPLHPRDVLVMVPDIAAYAPHIDAVFGRLTWDDARYLPYRIADWGQRRRQPLLIGLERLLDLPRSRFAVSELLDLLDLPPLRARFGLDASDLPRLRHWIEGANIRWGLDAEQRARLDLALPPGLTRNTWSFGLQRLLLGYASGGGAPWRGIEPHDDIGGLEAALAGPLTQLLDTLEDYWRLLQTDRLPADWASLIARLIADCFTAVDDTDHWALTQLQEQLDDWEERCRLGGGADTPLPLNVVRESLLAALDTPTLNQPFLAGAVNFATLMPMRAIPFRQIWLLGMSDGAYPRPHRPDDFDLMAGDYRPGDRSRREDDRYLFLEALLAAREKLGIGWVGHDPRDNTPRPPSVLVGQLRDHLAAGWRLAGAPDAGGAALLDALTVVHPLQPFSPRYFEPDRPARLFTYAREWRQAHAAPTAAGEAPSDAPEPPPVLAPPDPLPAIGLSTLGSLLRHPAHFFYARRLEVRLERADDPSGDDEPFAIERLAAWALRSRLLERVGSRLVQNPELDPDTLLDQAGAWLRQSGSLPLPPFDRLEQRQLTDELRTPLRTLRQLLRAYPRRVPAQPIALTAPSGATLQDSLTDLRADDQGQRIRLVLLASRLGAGKSFKWQHLTRHWPAHLAAQCLEPAGAPVVTRLLGPDTDLAFPPCAPADARARLDVLLDTALTALTTPLPLACKTGFALISGSGDPAGQYDDSGRDESPGECNSHPVYARFWPDYRALAADGRCAALAARLYRPLFEALAPIVAATSTEEADA